MKKMKITNQEIEKTQMKKLETTNENIEKHKSTN